MSTLGTRIAEYRKQCGMTQEQLAEHMDVSPQAVSKWENDMSCPDIAAPGTVVAFPVRIQNKVEKRG